MRVELQRMEQGQVRVFYTGEMPSIEALNLVSTLHRCYAQKAPWKNYHKSVADDIIADGEEVPEYETTCNYDYVEWLCIDDVRKVVTWGQGDFAVGCAFEDCIVEPVKLHYKDDDMDQLWVAVKPGGVLIYDDVNVVEAYIVNEDGFIGEFVLKEKTENSESWGAVTTAKKLMCVSNVDNLERKYRVQEELKNG